jgi:hypothetical protein
LVDNISVIKALSNQKFQILPRFVTDQLTKQIGIVSNENEAGRAAILKKDA